MSLSENIFNKIFMFSKYVSCMLVCIACIPRRLKGDRRVTHSYFFFSFKMFLFWVRHFLKLSDTGSVGNCSMSEAQFESDNLHLWGKAREKKCKWEYAVRFTMEFKADLKQVHLQYLMRNVRKCFLLVQLRCFGQRLCF